MLEVEDQREENLASQVKLLSLVTVLIQHKDQEFNQAVSQLVCSTFNDGVFWECIITPVCQLVCFRNNVLLG